MLFHRKRILDKKIAFNWMNFGKSRRFNCYINWIGLRAPCINKAQRHNSLEYIQLLLPITNVNIYVSSVSVKLDIHSNNINCGFSRSIVDIRNRGRRKTIRTDRNGIYLCVCICIIICMCRLGCLEEIWIQYPDFVLSFLWADVVISNCTKTYPLFN